MSHFTTVRTKIADVACLEQALYQLDFRVLHQARMRGWQGQTKKVSVVAQFNRDDCPYDIGFVHNPKTNTYDMVADWWAISGRIGLDEPALAGQITQRYAYNKVLHEVKLKGFMVSEEQLEADQSIRLVVRKW